MRDLDLPIPSVVHDLFFANLVSADEPQHYDKQAQNKTWWAHSDLDSHFKDVAFISFTPFCSATRIHDDVRGTLMHDPLEDKFHSFIPGVKSNESEKPE